MSHLTYSRVKSLLLAALFGAFSCYGQAGKGELLGSIRDSSGLPVSGARVTAEMQATRAQYAATSSDAGEYHLFGLPPGTYQVAIVKPGFREYRRFGIVLHVGDQVLVTAILEVGELAQTVEVTAGAPVLESHSATVNTVVEQERIVTLPLDGRNFIPLLALAPGVALPPGSFFPRINGSRPRTSEYLYDGISVLQPEPGQVAFYPVIDAIEEFRLNINAYSPEYGRSNGGAILVNTKSGTNALHGTLFEFFRNEKLNARNLFAGTSRKPVFRRNQFGYTIGGPIRKNKTFFFTDYQGSRLATGVTRISTVPTSLQKQGIFTEAISGKAPVLYDPATTRPAANGFTRDPFPGNRIPAERFDPAAAAVLARYPSPNVLSAGREAVANNYRRTAAETVDQNQFDARLDHYLAPGYRVFGRYSYLRDHSVPLTPLPDGSGDIGSAIIGDTLTRADSVVAEHSWNLSAASLNELRFGFTRRGFGRSAGLTGGTPADILGIPGIPSNAFDDALPAFQPAGYQQIGPPANSNSQFTTSVTQLADTFSALHGSHTIKAGADLRWERLDVLQPPNPTGLFQFTALETGQPGLATSGYPIASLLLGQVNSFNIDIQQEKLRPRAKIAEFFAMDEWRLMPRVNVGTRYTLNFPSTEAGNRGAIFNLATQQLDFLGKNGFPRSARKLEWGNFGPRIGIAYKPRDAFVVRSGYGLIWFEQAGITTPFTIPQFPFLRGIGQRSLDNVHPAFVLSAGPSVEIQPPDPDSGLGQGVFGVDRNNGSG